MAAPQVESVVDQDDSIREECEALIACEESEPVSKGRTAGEWLASRPWGQMIFKSLDRVLWCVERTMLWQNQADVNTPAPVGRPVNVLVAYPLAAFLWVLQHLVFVGAETSSASELIKWVQTRRRRLRAVRFQGIRNMRANNVLGRPETSRFAQVFWFLGMLPADKVVDDVKPKKDSEDYEEEVVPAEDTNSEQMKKRRFSAVSATTDEGALFLDDEEYNSEEDSDYVPDHSQSSESDSDLSSVDEDEEEHGDNLNKSVTEKKDSESVTKKEESPNKSVTDKPVTGKK